MSVTVSVKLAGAAVAGDVVLADVVVRSGRARADDGLNPASATVTFLTPTPAGVGVAIAQSLQVLANGASRFIGRVAEVTKTTAIDGSSVQYVVVAIGNISQLERVLMTLPIVAETAAARASRAITAGGFTATVTGGTTYNLAAYGKVGDAPTTAAQVLGDLMSDTGAVVADAGDGKILAQFPEARISGDRFTPDPAKVNADVDFTMTDELCNDIVIAYAGTTFAASSPSSITAYGKHSASLTTGLADVGSATRRGTSIVSRLSVPAWQVGSADTWDELILGHSIGAVVSLSPLPDATSPVPGSYQGVLEGWTEHYTPFEDGSNLIGGTWQMALSDLRHAAESLVWSAANPAEKWSTVLPATRWQDVLTNANL